MAWSRNANPDRMRGFSDEVFAVILTLFVPALKPQESSSFASLRSLSPPVSVHVYLTKVDRRLAHSKERDIREEKFTADRLAARCMARRRSLVVLASFTTAMLVAFIAPRLGFGLICGALIL